MAAPVRLRARVVRAIFLHEVRALLVNPSVTATAAMVLGFALVFTRVLGFYPSYAGPFLGQAAVTTVTAIGTVGMLVELRERGGTATLARSGATPGELAAGCVLAGIAVSELAAFLCALVVEGDVPRALVSAALLLATAAPGACAMTALGMAGVDQQHVSPWGSALVIWGMLVGAAPTVLGLPWLLPCGAASELMSTVLYGSAPAVPVACTVAAALGYLALSAAALRRALRA